MDGKIVIQLLAVLIEAQVLISLSQAKRVTHRFERFKRVELDFAGVSDVGQAIADELFHVFAAAHPTIRIAPINTDAWNDVLGRTLGRAERWLVQELREVRSRWAHQDPLTGDHVYRALDSVHRLLLAVSATQAEEVEKTKMELPRVRFDEQARSEKRRSAGTAIESRPRRLLPTSSAQPPKRPTPSTP